MIRGIRQRYRTSLRTRIKVPTLVLLTLMVSTMAVVSGALLRSSLEETSRTTCRRLANVLASDPRVILDVSFGKLEGRTAVSGLGAAFDRFVSSASAIGLAAYTVSPFEAESFERTFEASVDPDERPVFGKTIDADAFDEEAKVYYTPSGVTYALITVPVRMPAQTPGQQSLTEADTEIVGALQFAWSLEHASATASRYQMMIFGIGALVLLFGGWSSGRLARSILEPISVLHAGMRRVTEGEFGYRIESNRGDEIGQMAERFNGMGEHLEDSQRQIQDHARTLEIKVHERTRELRHALDELKTLDRAKDRFLSGISHEMQTPLTSILAAVEILTDFTDEDPVARAEFLNIVRREADRLLHQVGNILDLAKLEARTMELDKGTHDLGDLAQHAADELAEAAAERRIRIVTLRPEVALPYRCDGQRVGRILRGLLDNAIRFAPEETEIEIGVAKTEEDVVLTVRDHGPGIPPDQRRTLFGSLRETTMGREAEKGIGFGLQLCREFSRLHGGELVYEDAEGGGALFKVLLPLIEELTSALET